MADLLSVLAICSLFNIPGECYSVPATVIQNDYNKNICVVKDIENNLWETTFDRHYEENEDIILYLSDNETKNNINDDIIVTFAKK